MMATWQRPKTWDEMMFQLLDDMDAAETEVELRRAEREGRVAENDSSRYRTEREATLAAAEARRQRRFDRSQAAREARERAAA